MRAYLLPALLPLTACMTTTPDDARKVTYACDGGPPITVVYGGDNARIENPGGNRIELQRRHAPSGVTYNSATRTIRGDGDTIVYEIGRRAPMTCRAVTP